MKAYQIKSCAEVPPNNSKALQNAVFQQPVSVAIDVEGFAFQFYRKGVFTKKCDIDVNHAVLLTGFGTLNGTDYWECKNSWGKKWGIDGYLLLERDNEDGPGKCGILTQAAVPQN